MYPEVKPSKEYLEALKEIDGVRVIEIKKENVEEEALPVQEVTKTKEEVVKLEKKY